jgi:hypothetical protein
VGRLLWLAVALLLAMSSAKAALADGCLVNSAHGPRHHPLPGAFEFRGASANACVFVTHGDAGEMPDHGLVDLGGVFGGAWSYVGIAGSPQEYRLNNNLLAPNIKVSFALDQRAGPGDPLRGTYTLKWDDMSAPARLDLALVIDVGDGWAGLVFSNDIFTGTGSMTQNWDVRMTDGLHAWPRQPTLGVYARAATVPCIECGTGSLPVPSPAWLLLIGAGLFSWGLRYRQS